MDPEFRFILVEGADGKKPYKSPVEKNFLSFNNYCFIDPSFKQWLQQGNNYGILAGKGNLVILDLDHKETIERFYQDLPETFTVKTGRPTEGIHGYFYCDDRIPTTVIGDGSYGTIIGKDAYAVGPGSYHKEGTRYEVINPTRIAPIKKDTLNWVFKDFFTLSNNTVTVKTETKITNNNVQPLEYNYPITKHIIGDPQKRRISNITIQKPNPSYRERLGLIFTLACLPKWNHIQISNFIHDNCNWDNYDRQTTISHIEDIFNRYAHKIPGSENVNRGGKVAAPASPIYNNPPVHDYNARAYEKAYPCRGKGGIGVPGVQTLKEYGKVATERKYWIFAKNQMQKGNDLIDFYQIQQGKIGKDINGNPAFMFPDKSITMPSNPSAFAEIVEAMSEMGKDILFKNPEMEPSIPLEPSEPVIETLVDPTEADATIQTKKSTKTKK